MAERLVILSDMLGSKSGLWITSYLGYLQQYYDIVYYDSQQLANIDVPIKTLKNIEAAFHEGGIDTAVAHLLKKEDVPSHYLTFCAGGNIAWKAGRMGLPIKSLTAVSPLDLSEQTAMPDCPVKLVYGANDHYLRPSDEWTARLAVPTEVIPGFGHQLYSDEKIIQKICKDLLDSLLNRQYQKL